MRYHSPPPLEKRAQTERKTLFPYVFLSETNIQETKTPYQGNLTKWGLFLLSCHQDRNWRKVCSVSSFENGGMYNNRNIITINTITIIIYSSFLLLQFTHYIVV